MDGILCVSLEICGKKLSNVYKNYDTGVHGSVKLRKK
jgi:hypothetical protein